AAGVGVARDHPADVAVPEVDTAVSPLDGGDDSTTATAAGGDFRDGTGPSAAAAGSVASSDSPDNPGNPDNPGSPDNPDKPENPDTLEGTEAPERIVVSVQGLVEHSGLFHLDRGARVAAALDAAGGPLDGADLLSLNLAQKLHDGDQVLVGVAPPDGGPPRLGSATVSAGAAVAG